MIKFYKFFTILLFLPTLVLTSCNGQININDGTSPNQQAKYNVLKKGIGVSRYNDKSISSGQKIDNLNVGWYYNWGIDNPDQDHINAEYVPMIWGASSVNENNLKKIKDGYEKGKYSHLLTFNEPDNNSQSNMTVSKAIEIWPQLEALGIPLSSPCPADYSSGWLDDFMKEAKRLNYRVDFIAVHCYQDFSISGVENKMKTDVLDVLYQKYQLPIWLTEYGAIDISVWAGGGKHNVNCTEKAAKKYIENSTKLLEKLGYVERYAWFVDNFNERGDSRPKEAPYTSLYQDDDNISSTGKIYKAIESNVSLSITTSKLNQGNINEKYEQIITAQGGKGNYTFTASSLPKGLQLTTSGKLIGTPESFGEFKIKIAVKDEFNQTSYRDYLLNINN